MHRESLTTLLQPVIEAQGYDLWELEYAPGRGNATLRIYIDTASHAGITVDDCEKASRAISEVLDATDPIPGNYTLEVSSPGLDRPLRHAADYRRFTGRLAKLVTHEPIDGQSAFAGRLAGVDEGVVLLQEGRRTHRVPLAQIKRGRLDVEF